MRSSTWTTVFRARRARRVHLLDRRSEQHVDALGLGDRRVACGVAGVGGEILGRARTAAGSRTGSRRRGRRRRVRRASANGGRRGSTPSSARDRPCGRTRRASSQTGADVGDALDGDHCLVGRTGGGRPRPRQPAQIGVVTTREPAGRARPRAAYAPRSAAGSASRWRATVTRSPRATGPVSAAAGPSSTALSSDARAKRDERVERDAGRRRRGARPGRAARRGGSTPRSRRRVVQRAVGVVDAERDAGRAPTASSATAGGPATAAHEPGRRARPASADGSVCSGCSAPTSAVGSRAGPRARARRAPRAPDRWSDERARIERRATSAAAASSSTASGVATTTSSAPLADRRDVSRAGTPRRSPTADGSRARQACGRRPRPRAPTVRARAAGRGWSRPGRDRRARTSAPTGSRSRLLFRPFRSGPLGCRSRVLRDHQC